MRCQFNKPSLFWVFLLALFFWEAQSAPVKVGAIRWDAWVGPPNFAGIEVELNLAPNHFHYRLPFYGVDGNDTVQARAITQAVIDSELVFAHRGGINYFAYLIYTDEMKTARELHLTSSVKSLVKYCWIIDGQTFENWPAYLSFLTTTFADTDYVKVLGNRPLVYSYAVSSLTQVGQIDSACQALGIGAPYYVDMTGDLGGMAAAGGHYARFSGSPGEPYSALMANCRNSWDDYSKTIPLVSAGWDPRPRTERAGLWSGYYNGNWTVAATPDQIAALLQQAVNYVVANPVHCEANAVLIYAWNEFDEGGYICPNLPAYGGAARLNAIAGVNHNPDPSGQAKGGVWKFNGNLLDSLGFSNGAAQGGLSYGTGLNGEAVVLNGTDGGVSIEDNGRLSVSNVTLSLWVKLNALPAQNLIPAGKESSYRFVIGSDGSAHFVVATANNAWYSSGTTAGAPAGSVAAGTWVLLTGTYDGSRTRIFVNGDSAGSGTAISGGLVINSNPLAVGIKSYSNIDWLDGSVDDLRLYSVALSDTAIRHLYEQGNLGTPLTGHSPAKKGTSLQCEPNPFNPATTIQYRLPGPAGAVYTLYDSRGSIIRQYQIPAGILSGSIRWDGRDLKGQLTASGLYIGKLQTMDGTVLTHGLMLIH
jgi:hypothetical protein